MVDDCYYHKIKILNPDIAKLFKDGVYEFAIICESGKCLAHGIWLKSKDYEIIKEINK